MAGDGATGRELFPVTQARGSRARERARAIEKLNLSEERFFHVFQASPVAIILRTLDEGRVIDVNARYTELVGFQREELVGRTVREMGLWADWREGERVLARLRQRGNLRNVEGRFRHKSGEIRDVLISAELTEIDGETVVIGMIIDITERKRMETELMRSREQLRLLSARLQQIREEERIRIAREIHDELGGFLTVLKLDLSSLGKEPTTQSPSFRHKVDAMSKTMVAAIGSVRRICSDLRPSVLDHIGLTAAIEWQVQEWQEKSGIRCSMSSMIDDDSVDVGRATAAFRVLQEALTNVARHAQATSVRVRLWTEEARLRLEVRDNGRGIPASTIGESTSLGLLGMKERVLSFGGTVDIRGATGEGTTVDVSIPLAETSTP
ncbi:MAG TPA: PAS domain-containing sensor histidine kinase [Candidatus Binatia bacterium]|nr:PAS domain-containing sensor histidine kinase [Candidatus Binatia bacterium]